MSSAARDRMRELDTLASTRSDLDALALVYVWWSDGLIDAAERAQLWSFYKDRRSHHGR